MVKIVKIVKNGHFLGFLKLGVFWVKIHKVLKNHFFGDCCAISFFWEIGRMLRILTHNHKKNFLLAQKIFFVKNFFFKKIFLFL